MFIKKFVGEDLDQIQDQIIEELGINAVVLTTRTIDPGFLQSLFFPDEYEVTVGVDPQDLKEHQKPLAGSEDSDKLRLLSMAAMKRLQPLGFESSEPRVMRIPVTGPLKFDAEQKNLVALVGAKGVGKTTTLTKLALKLQQTTPFKVALASTGGIVKDRIDELNNLAHMFNLQHHHVNSSSELKRVMQKLDHHEIFLLDTPGDYDSVEIAAYLSAAPSHKVLLVVSAADPIADQLAAAEKYRPLNPVGLIITKLNQSPDIIMLSQLALKQQIPFSYLAEGSDLKLADSDELEIRIINEKLRLNNL